MVSQRGRMVSRLDDFLLALLVVALADAVLFHGGAYTPLLQPSSHSGEVARQEQRLARSYRANPGRKRIVVMGNSITVSCIQERQLETELAADGHEVDVLNMAIGSTTPRSWLLLLDNGQVTADNTTMVILGLNPASVQASSSDLGDRDLKISKTHLRLSDALTIAGTYADLEMRMTAVSSAIFRTALFREDLKQYLENPRERHRQLTARATAETSDARRENRWRRDITTARLGDDGKIVFDELPAFLKKKHRLRANIERLLQARAKYQPRPGNTTRPPRADPRQLAIVARMVERLNAKGIEVVFSVIPGSPYPLGALDASAFEVLHDALRQRGADVAWWHDPALIARIESPEFYRDRLHLNAEGAGIYTRGLADVLATHLPRTSTDSKS